jgi:hypothetical protein
MKVLAKIPADNGRKINTNQLLLEVSSSWFCDDCDVPATTVIQGETDSFGFEIIILCDECLKPFQECH